MSSIYINIWKLEISIHHFVTAESSANPCLGRSQVIVSIASVALLPLGKFCGLWLQTLRNPHLNVGVMWVAPSVRTFQSLLIGASHTSEPAKEPQSTASVSQSPLSDQNKNLHFYQKVWCQMRWLSGALAKHRSDQSMTSSEPSCDPGTEFLILSDPGCWVPSFPFQMRGQSLRKSGIS